LYFGVYRLLELWRLIQQRDWTLFVSGAGAGLAIKMILEACMGA
jgi:hypothetical protein